MTYSPSLFTWCTNLFLNLHSFSENLAVDSKFYFPTVTVLILGNTNIHMDSYFRQYLISFFTFFSLKILPKFSSPILSYKDTLDNYNHQNLDLIFKILNTWTLAFKKIFFHFSLLFQMLSVQLFYHFCCIIFSCLLILPFSHNPSIIHFLMSPS